MSNQTISVRMFVQKNRPCASGKVPIFARIRLGRESIAIATKLYINDDQWGHGQTIGTTKELKAINALLEQTRVKIFQTHTELIRAGEIVTCEKLKLALQGKPYTNDCRHFVQLFDKWLEDYRKQIGI